VHAVQLARAALDRPRHLRPPSGIGAVDRDLIPRPQIARSQHVLLGDEINNVHALAGDAVVAGSSESSITRRCQTSAIAPGAVVT
jgi:hypothetical protein